MLVDGPTVLCYQRAGQADGAILLGRARILLVVTILYNVVEGVIALWSGIVSGSIALEAFGANSYMVVSAASLVL